MAPRRDLQRAAGRVAEKYLRKGSKVYVEGQLQTRKWTDQQGQERYTTEVVLTRFRGELTMLDGAGGAGGRAGAAGAMDPGYDDAYGGGGGPGDSPRYGGTGPSGAGVRQRAAGRGRSTRDDLDDEIPF